MLSIMIYQSKIWRHFCDLKEITFYLYYFGKSFHWLDYYFAGNIISSKMRLFIPGRDHLESVEEFEDGRARATMEDSGDGRDRGW